MDSSAPASAQHREFKYFDLVMATFVTILLCSDLIGVGKVCQILGFSVGAGVFFFPISYVFGDILTEVYGYARSRRVIWAGFGALAFASFMSWAVIALPPAPQWLNQEAYETVYGQTPRIVVASLMAFWAGDFINSYVLAKLKITTNGRFLWIRTIGSTIVGQAVDSIIFYPFAFFGLWTTSLLYKVMISNFLIKVGVEVLMTPFTYAVVGFLKSAEHVDFYDRGTDFNPFTLKD